MPAIVLRSDWDGARVRAAVREAAEGTQVRRLLAIAAVYEGKTRSEAARAGAMDRQTLRDWARLGAPLQCRGSGWLGRPQGAGCESQAEPGAGGRTGGADRCRS